ncbi:hypothetical protein D3C78_994880 [compost metagenome]
MGVLVQGLCIDQAGHALLALLAFVLMTQQVLVGNDIRPVVTTGVVHTEQHLAETCEPGQRLQCLGGQRGNAEDNHP